MKQKYIIIFSIGAILIAGSVLADQQTWTSGNFKYIKTENGVKVVQLQSGTKPTGNTGSNRSQCISQCVASCSGGQQKNVAAPTPAVVEPILQQPEQPSEDQIVSPADEPLLQITSPSDSSILQTTSPSTENVIQDAASALLNGVNSFFNFIISPLRAIKILK